MRFHGSAFTDPTYELPVNNEDLAENADLNAATFGKVHSVGVGPKIPKSESSKGKKKRKIFYKISSLSKGSKIFHRY